MDKQDQAVSRELSTIIELIFHFKRINDQIMSKSENESLEWLKWQNKAYDNVKNYCTTRLGQIEARYAKNS